MSKTPQFEQKISTILNELQPHERVCELTGERWLFDNEHLSWCRKLRVPPSQYSPKTRLKVLTGFGTGIGLWKNRHALTGEPLLSCVHPDSPLKVITDKEWHAADFLGTQSINSSQSILQQLTQLVFSTPLPATFDNGSNRGSIGVEMIDAEDCYLGFGGLGMRRLDYYSIGSNSEDCVDVTNVNDIRECTQINHCDRLYRCRYTLESYDCINGTFLFDCRNCEFCFGATNQRNKKYLFFNKQLSKEQWEDAVSRIDLCSYQVWQQQYEAFQTLMREDAIWPERFLVNCDDCQGDYLTRCVRVHEGFWQIDSKDCFWSPFNAENEDGYFTVWAGRISQSYSSVCVWECQELRNCFGCEYSRQLEYCYRCLNCEYCFGCVGLKRQRFCIFNKQYSEEEYWKLVDALKCAMLDRGEYGRFFSPACSPYGYQFAIGMLFSVYDEDELSLLGAPLFDKTASSVVEAEHGVIISTNLPDSSLDPSAASFVSKPILDPISKRLYSITPREFAFYQKHQLPLPRQHPLERLWALCKLSNAIFPVKGQCDNCSKSLSFHPNQTFASRKVFCEPCYLRYIEERG